MRIDNLRIVQLPQQENKQKTINVLETLSKKRKLTCGACNRDILPLSGVTQHTRGNH